MSEDDALDEVVIDEVTGLPEGLTVYNAYEFVPKPPGATWTLENHGTTATITVDEYGDAVIRLSYGTPGETPHLALSTELDDEALLAVHEQIFAPLLDRVKKIEELTAAAEAADEVRQQRLREEAEAYDASASLQKQEVSKDGYSTHWRLHRKSCAASSRGRRVRPAGPLTFDDLVTRELPKIHAQFERLRSPESVRRNQTRGRNQYRGQRLDKTVLELCGKCKPLGDETKAVEQRLYALANPMTQLEDPMLAVVQALIQIEEAARKIDEEYQASRTD